MTRRPYSVVAAQALVLCIGGYVLNFLAPAAPIALAVNVLCLWRLFSVAQTYARDAVEGFDATVAAEAIVGFGVMALVLGLATLVFLFISGQLILTAAETGTMDFRGATPFAEGLVTAGLTPFFAIFLRLRIAELTGVVDPADDMASLARATSSLTRTLTDANKALDVLRMGSVAAGTSATGLADVMRSEIDRWSLALQDGSAALKGFGVHTDDAGALIGQLGAETNRLKTAMGETTTLLAELTRLIDEVERFVAPATRRA